MNKKILFGAALLFCGLAQAQPQFQWPPGFYKNDLMPMLLAESMPHEVGEDLPVLSQVFKSELRQTVGAPQRVWVARYKGWSNSGGIDIAVDYAGEVYLTGAMRNIYDYDFLNIKYNSSGVRQWVRQYDGSGGGDEALNSDYVLKLIADFDENIYVAGSSEDGFGSAYAVFKYNHSGDNLWTSHYDGYGNGQAYGDYAQDFVVDRAGNVYITGTSVGSSGVADYATVKFGLDGKIQWVGRYNSSKTSTAVPAAIALDPEGNVCVTGGSWGANGTYDYTTIKYDPAGSSLWVANYNRFKNSQDYPRAVTIDAAGNVYVSGFSKDSGALPHWHLVTIKYNRAGARHWVAILPLAISSTYSPVHLKIWVAGFENVYLSGAGISNTNYVIIKYNKAGVLQWGSRYRGGASSMARVSDMALDEAGNIYVTGWRTKSAINQNWDYVTIKYNNAGQMQWLQRYNGPQNRDDFASAVAVDRSGNVYVTGASYGVGQYDVVTIKYSQNSGSASKPADTDAREIDDTHTAKINLPDDFYLTPNHPNPFSASGTFGNPGTSIRFGLPQASRVTLKVYNVLSEEVATLVDGLKPAGEHAVQFAPKQNLPSGIYFSVLDAGATRLVQRMVYAK